MILRHAVPVDLRTLGRREEVDLRLAEGRVTAIGSDLPAEPGEQSIDAAGMYLLPGLVNSHAHSAMSLLRGAAEDVTEESWFNEHIWIYERNLQPEDVYWGTLLGAAEMLLAGVTSVADHYFAMDHAFRAYRQAGMRADLSWAVFGTGAGWEAQFEEALGFTREHRDRDPTLTVSLGPHSPYICPPAFLRRVAAKAEELGLRMHVHVAEVERQVRRSLQDTGMTPVGVLESTGVLRPGTILAHACYATDRDLERIRAAGAAIAHCPKTYLKFGDLPDLLLRAQAAGVIVGLGTDGPASNNTLSIFETARDAALLAKCARRDATAATLAEVLPLLHAGGRLLGLPGYGAIREGSVADLILLDPRAPNLQPEASLFANLLYSLNERNVHTVIVNGRVVVRGGKLVTVDTEELYARAGEITRRLLRRNTKGPMQRY